MPTTMKVRKRQPMGLLDAKEREALVEALTETGGNKFAAARILGCSVPGLYLKLERHGIKVTRTTTNKIAAAR